MISTSINLIGLDARYTQITEFITLYSGDPQGFMTFLNDIEKFYPNDPNTSTDINNGKTHVSIDKTMGSKHLTIWEEEGSGFHKISFKLIQKTKDAFINWITQNNIVLK